MLGIATRDLSNCKLGRRGDRPNAFAVAQILGPAQLELAGALTHREVDARMLRQAEASGLENGRDRRADDILAMFGKLGMAASAKPREAIARIAVDSNLEHFA
jgi:hypothetical protein